MKNVYLGLGGVVILAAGFTGGYICRESLLKQDETAGTVIAKDLESVTLRLADDSVRTIQLGPHTLVSVRQPLVPASFADIQVGTEMQASMDKDGLAKFMLLTPADSSFFPK